MRARFSFCALIAGLVFASLSAQAGGPRYVAGSTYFAAEQRGQPILWEGGRIAYFTDQGDLSGSVPNAAANATVAAAAAIWNAVPTAAVSITAGGTLAEDVNGSNVITGAGGVALPADIQSTAVSTPVGIVYDADGSVIDALFGTGASDPDDCIDTGATAMVDNLAPNGTIAHALILINGRCTGTSAQLEQIEFQLVRAFGRVLGLGWSQANDAVLSGGLDPSLQQLEGWPMMRPVDVNCNQLSTQCIPGPLQLRADDTAALSRLYPVTAANLAQFPGKEATAASTISIHGSVYFRRGQGMQGVNVVARPITSGALQPDDRYPVSSVSGFLYAGDRGSPVNGAVDATGAALSNFGSDDPLVEGFYDLSGIPLPPGESAADYQITLEPVNPLYTGSLQVGPYAQGTPAPSGTLPVVALHGLAAGMSVEQNFTIGDSAGDLQNGAGGLFSAPAWLSPDGEWEGRVATPGQAAWFALPVLAGRHFTIESGAIDEAGEASEDKLRAVIGVWDGSDAEGSPAVNATVAPFNGAATGVTALGVDANANGELLLAVADQRGDGRPDYTYHGRILYAATVMPQRLPLAGGTIQITGRGFHPGMTVGLGGQIAATVTQITPTLIVATVPASVVYTGSLDLVVHDPATNGYAVIAGGISYGDASDDALSITTALPATVNVGATAPFVVRVFDPDQVKPVAGVPVTFSVLEGSANFGNCGAGLCTVMTTSDGYAAVSVTPGSVGFIKLQASLTTGAKLLAEITGSTLLSILPVENIFFLAPGAGVAWIAQVQVADGLTPVANAAVTWTGQGNLSSQAGTNLTSTQGIAGCTFAAGPWPEGTSAPITACLGLTNTCASLSIYVVHAAAENLAAVAGLDQELLPGGTPSPIVVRLIAPGGQPVAGGVVTFRDTERSWTPACVDSSPCPVGRLLGGSVQMIVSDQNGLASFLPSVPAGVPVLIQGEAQAGADASLPFRVEIQP